MSNENSSKFTWQPIEQFNDEIIDCSIKIKEPPCANCIHWNPHKIYKYHELNSLKIFSIVCCTNDHMLTSFNCFELKE